MYEAECNICFDRFSRLQKCSRCTFITCPVCLVKLIKLEKTSICSGQLQHTKCVERSTKTNNNKVVCLANPNLLLLSYSCPQCRGDNKLKIDELKLLFLFLVSSKGLVKIRNDTSTIILYRLYDLDNNKIELEILTSTT